MVESDETLFSFFKERMAAQKAVINPNFSAYFKRISRWLTLRTSPVKPISPK